MEISKKEFERLVAAALDTLPTEFARALENVSVTIEEEMAEDDLIAMGLDPAVDTLFGLYHGIALPDRGLDYSSLPDRIVIYRLPILEACEEREQVVEEIRQTVLHELGHYFGLDEDEMPE